MRCDVLSRSVFFFFFCEAAFRASPSPHLYSRYYDCTLRYDAARPLFFFFALVCHVNLKCNLVAHLVYHLAPPG